METKNEILDLSFKFAIEIIEFTELLEAGKKYVIAKQLLKSGTSAGTTVREAQNTHGRKDFIAKCVIAAKEASETEYWLLLCQKSKNYPDPDQLPDQVLSLKKLLSKIIAYSIKHQKS